ncbi:peptide ABC transporter substrate-binding protein [Aureibacillus halotolerans]|uniref:Oligopeptide transport system substrate-binding protein n=1 Tax=Aureibacillus halotolerans TaxID=1508390 RepID=A0A4R6U8D6_9BACI|nr:peptide ABC transporter substrate-binding protein [Aureibacillus halotolerans]TDQ42818.1 oligopeptide transport system substrate-binding protein [Aureibacillus halotolerans]
MKKGTKFWLFALVAALMLVISACSGGGSDTESADNGTDGETTEEQATDESAAAGEQVLNLSEGDEISSMDSTQITDTISFTALNNAMEGLLRMDENDQTVLGMAAEEPTISEDGTVWTFKIRDDAKWSNEEPVTAGDFVYAWQKALSPDTLSQYAYIFAPVKNATAIITDGSDVFGQVDQLGVKAVDEKTLEITLENPVPYFKGLLAFPVYFPQPEAFATEKGGAYGTTVENTLYNGPFVLSEWNPGAGWSFAKNEGYWDAETVQLAAVNVQVVKDQQADMSLYETGEIDQKWGLRGEYATRFQGNEELHEFKESAVFYLLFNNTREYFQNENIRRAIELGYDKEGHATVIQNNGSVAADYLVPQGLSKTEDGADYREIAGTFNDEPTDAANEYFQKGLQELGQESLTIELLTDDTEGAGLTAQFIQEQLQQNLQGLTVNINQQPFTQRLDLSASQQFDMVISGWSPDYQDPQTFLELFICDNGNNDGKYCNEEYDALMAEASAEFDDIQKRFELFAEAEKLLLEGDVAISPIYQRGILYLRKPYVQDLYVHVFGAEFSYKWASIDGSKN